MKKLRLLFTKNCDRKCVGCCNNELDFSKIPVVDHFDYDEILITGGEPLLYVYRLIGFVQALKIASPKAKIYVYTAIKQQKNILNPIYKIIRYVDGLTLTLHEPTDVEDIKQILHDIVINKEVAKIFKNKSLRLNVFKGIDVSQLDLSQWKVKKDMKWIKNCPLPEGEELRKL